MSNEKVYVRSNGEIVKISEMETTHLARAYNLKVKELFQTEDEEEYNKLFRVTCDLQEELTARIQKEMEKFKENED